MQLDRKLVGAAGRLAMAAGLVVVGLVGCGKGQGSTSVAATPTAVIQAPSSAPSLPPTNAATNVPVPTDGQDGSTKSGCLPDASGVGNKLQMDLSEGPFTFEIGIVEDPRFKPAQVGLMPADTSGVLGVGWFHQWTYEGPDVGPAIETWGQVIEGDFGSNMSGGKQDVLRGGQQPLFTGGIVPTQLQAGQQIELADRVEVGGQAYGAIMSLNIQASDGNLIACDPTFQVWPSTAASTVAP